MAPNVGSDPIYADENTPLIQTHPSSTSNTDAERGNNVEPGGSGYVEIGDEDKPVKFLCFTASSKSSLKQCMGIGFVVLAGILFTFSNVIQKKLKVKVNHWHLLLFRAIIQISSMGAVVAYRRAYPLGSSWMESFRIVLQGMFGGLLLLFIYIAIQHVPLGNGSAIFFCTPVFTFIFAICMLGERMGIYRVLISASMLAGVVMIARPPFIFGADISTKNVTSSVNTGTEGYCDDQGVCYQSFNFVAYSVAFMVPVMSAIVSIITRQLKHIHASILMLWFGMGGLVVSLGGLIYTGQYNFENYTKSPVTIVGIMGIVVLGIAGNVLYTVAMKYVSPSKANVFRSFEVILNYVLQITIEHMSFHLISIAGIACLLLAVIATGFENEAMKKWRAKFRFL